MISDACTTINFICYVLTVTNPTIVNAAGLKEVTIFVAFFSFPSISILRMDSGVTGLTQSNQIATIMSSALRQWNLMMHFLCLHKNSLAVTNFTKRMFAYKFVSDTFPSSAVPTAYSRISVVLLVALVLFLLMLLTKPSVCQLWATRITARSLRLSWHLVHLLILDIRKALQESSPTRLVHCTFADSTISHNGVGHFRTNVDISGVLYFYRIFRKFHMSQCFPMPSSNGARIGS